MKKTLLTVSFSFLTFFFTSVLLSSCATSTPSSSDGRPVISESQYLDVLEKHSDRARSYSGFHNSLDVTAVMITSSVAQAQLDQARRVYQWTNEKYLAEKQKFEQRLSTESEFFISFFTPERKNDDLAKTDSVWRLFIDVDGRRYDAKVEKVKLPFAEIQGVYPNHSRFTTAYRVVFAVPMQSIENSKVQMTVTSPIAQALMKWLP